MRMWGDNLKPAFFYHLCLYYAKLACRNQHDLSRIRSLSLKKSQPVAPSTGWTLVAIWVGSFLNNCFFMWSTGVDMHIDIDVMGYDVRGMIIGVIVPCFTTFISYLVIRDY